MPQLALCDLAIQYEFEVILSRFAEDPITRRTKVEFVLEMRCSDGNLIGYAHETSCRYLPRISLNICAKKTCF